jgi:hypothetical protein
MSTIYTIEKLLREIADELPDLKRRVEDLETRTRARKWLGRRYWR